MRAPTGTKLEVPIPKVVSCISPETLFCISFIYLLILTQNHSYPTKYQIYLKSINGPVDVLLLNKHSVSSPLLVLPVPPPEDILQNARVGASDDTERDIPPCPALVYPSRSTRFRQPAMEDIWTSNFVKAEPDRSGASGCEYCALHSVNMGQMFRLPKHDKAQARSFSLCLIIFHIF